MRPLSALLTIVLLLVCGCSKKAKLSTTDQPQQAQHEEPEVRAATPDDPGPVETVISPLSILKKQAKPPLIKPEESAPLAPLLVDHHVNPAWQDSKKILNKVFSVNKYTQFEFVVPAHEGNTRLRGAFRSFTKRGDPQSSDKAAAVDLMLFNEQEFNEFIHGQPPNNKFEVDSAHDQIVDWRVPTTYEQPQTYHLVFSNSGGAKTKFVDADFTISFQ